MSRRLVQITAGVARGDAVTNYVRFLDRYLISKGHFSSSRIYAENLAENRPGRIGHVCTYTPSPSDVIVYHHSVGFRHLAGILFPYVRPLLVYHNITPAAFYSPWDFRSAGRMELGRMQLAGLARICPRSVALSEFSAIEIRAAGFPHVEVLPYPAAATILGKTSSAADRSQDPYRVLFVGRIAPNKRIDLLLRVFKLIEEKMRRSGRKVELVVAGSGTNDRYTAYIHRLADEMELKGHVRWTGYVDDSTLSQIWDQSSLYLSLSEHEGFGVPLMEAMGRDVPILALCADQSSVLEVLGGSGVGFYGVSENWVADSAYRMMTDSRLRDMVIGGQRRRLAEIGSVDVGARIHKILQEMMSDR